MCEILYRVAWIFLAWIALTGPLKHVKLTTTRDTILKTETKADVVKAESECGYKNTILLNLPYFNPPRMRVIDPMHNFFGVQENNYMLTDIWLERKLITKSHFNPVQDRMGRKRVPSDMGRIPHKIISGPIALSPLINSRIGFSTSQF